MFSQDSLHSTTFDWNVALSLVTLIRSLQSDSGGLVRLATEEWGLRDCAVLRSADVLCFVGQSDGTKVVAFESTARLVDWLAAADLKASDTRLGKCHAQSLAAFESIESELRRTVFDGGMGKAAVIFTGHGAGGAIAALAAAMLGGEVGTPSVYTFGQPAFAGANFSPILAEDLETTGWHRDRFFRMVLQEDVIAGLLPGFHHFGIARTVDRDGHSQPDSEVSARIEVGFDQLKAVCQAIQGRLQTNPQLTSGASNDIGCRTLEGHLPQIAAHRLERYFEVAYRLTKANRKQPTKAVPLDLQLLAARGLREPRDSDEVYRSLESTGEEVEVRTPVLIHLQSSDWRPPAGLTVYSRFGSFVTASATSENIAAIAADSSVDSIESSADAGYFGPKPPSTGGQQETQPPTSPEKGDSAIVGIIDTGIDIFHKAFLEADGTTALLGIWNQRESGDGSLTPNKVDPERFAQDYGTFLDADAINARLKEKVPQSHWLRDPDRDAYGNLGPGHGTHVSSIAAGRPFTGFNGGMASAAKILLVIPSMRSEPGDPPSLGYSVSHLDALHFLRAAAEKFGKRPIVVNLSSGMNAGAHDGKSKLERAFDTMSDNGGRAGFVIVKSAGNEGEQKGHAEVSAVHDGIVKLKWKTVARARRRDYIEVWYSPFLDLQFTLMDPGGNRSSTAGISQRSVLQVLGSVRLSLDLVHAHPDNGDCLLRIEIRPDGVTSIPAGTWTLEILGVRASGANNRVHAWVERDSARAVEFISGDVNAMTVTVPGTAEHVVTVAACTSTTPLEIGDFSSQGPTRNNAAKPDICAPGVAIVAAASGGHPEALTTMDGTSQAAPHVTGTVALALSSRAKSGKRQLNSTQIASLLRTSAKSASGVHHAQFGFGSLDADEFLRRVEAYP